MSAQAAASPSGPTTTTETANHRLKRSWDSRFWGSMIAAILLHFAVFQFFPTLTAADISVAAAGIETIEIQREVIIPPDPEQVPRPATPVVADADVPDDLTIAPTNWSENPVDHLPPPPTSSGGADPSAGPPFTPFTVGPEITNRAEVTRALEREYPAVLRDAGIGGTVRVWFHIDEHGRVVDTRLQEGSGHRQLDEAALRVADVMDFSPALDRDRNVPVWVAFPITFRVR